jgi:hypothetical protein
MAVEDTKLPSSKYGLGALLMGPKTQNNYFLDNRSDDLLVHFNDLWESAP